MKKERPPHVRCLAAALLCALLAGCNSSNAERIDEFANFAEVGIAYSDAMSELIDVATLVAIDADSATLITARRGGAASIETLLSQNEALLEYAKAFQDTRSHLFALRAYFTALESLATTGEGLAIREELDTSFRRIAALNERIAEAEIGDTSVKSLVTESSSFLIRNFQRKALEQELRAREATIRRALHLHEALIALLQQELLADLKGITELEMTISVADPYLDTSRALPRTWSRSRRDLLTAEASAAALGEAKAAITEFRLSFEQLLQSGLSPLKLNSVLKSIDDLTDLLSRIRGLDPQP